MASFSPHSHHHLQLEDFLKGYEEQEASVWIDLGHEGNIFFHYSRKVNYSRGGMTAPSRAGQAVPIRRSIFFGLEDHLC